MIHSRPTSFIFYIFFFWGRGTGSEEGSLVGFFGLHVEENTDKLRAEAGYLKDRKGGLDVYMIIRHLGNPKIHGVDVQLKEWN